MAERVYLLKREGKQILEDDEGSGLPEEYGEFYIMRMMGWDYWTFQRQPKWFIEMCLYFMAAEIKADKDGGEE